MKVKLSLIVELRLCLAWGCSPTAQEQQQQQSPPPAPQASVVAGRAGDQIVSAWSRRRARHSCFWTAGIISSVQVDSDGNLSSLPFLEKPIIAKCRTDKDVQKDIAAAYSKFINNPQVSVRISERNSRQPATVFGAVRQPTRVEMKRKVRLNELMAVSGGFTERASGTIQILHTEPLMCPEPGEENLAAPIDGTRIPLNIIKIADLRSGKAGSQSGHSSWRLRAGDRSRACLHHRQRAVTGRHLSPRRFDAEPCTRHGRRRAKRSETDGSPHLSSGSGLLEPGSH